MRKSIAAAVLAAAALLAPAAIAASLDAPDPIHGVTFDEWTAVNARLSHGEALPGLIARLGVDEAKWAEVNTRFTAELAKGPPGNGLIDRYGEIFSDPRVGRFRDDPKPLEQKAKLATFKDYARVQAHLSVGVEAGVDPQAVLKEHGLTTWEFSQEAGNWVQEYARAASTGDDGETIRRMQGVQHGFENEYRRRYGLKEKPAGD